MTFWFTLLLRAHSLAHDTVLTEVAVGASSSSLWLECIGLPVPVSCLSEKGLGIEGMGSIRNEEQN